MDLSKLAQNLKDAKNLRELTALLNRNQGPQGIGIKKVEINKSGQLVIHFTDGIKKNLGTVIGKDGKNIKGDTGLGVLRGFIEDDTLMLQLTNKKVIEIGNLRGKKGDQGTQGLQGVPGESYILTEKDKEALIKMIEMSPQKMARELETLEDNERLDASAIKNLPDHASEIANLQEMTSVAARRGAVRVKDDNDFSLTTHNLKFSGMTVERGDDGVIVTGSTDGGGGGGGTAAPPETLYDNHEETAGLAYTARQTWTTAFNFDLGRAIVEADDDKLITADYSYTQGGIKRHGRQTLNAGEFRNLANNTQNTGTTPPADAWYGLGLDGRSVSSINNLFSRTVCIVRTRATNGNDYMRMLVPAAAHGSTVACTNFRCKIQIQAAGSVGGGGGGGGSGLTTAQVQALIDAAGHQTAAQVQTAIGAAGHQTSSQVQAAIGGAGHATEDQVTALGERIDNLPPPGGEIDAYKQNTQYEYGDIVLASGKVYQATESVINESPDAPRKYDISDMYYQQIDVSEVTTTLGGGLPSARGMTISPDGRKLWITGYSSEDRNIHELTLEEPWNLDSEKADLRVSFDYGAIPQVASGANAIKFSPDGTLMYLCYGFYIGTFNLTTPWSVATAAYFNRYSISSRDTEALDVTFDNTGTRMFVVGARDNDINEFVLSTAWLPTTASYNTRFVPSGQTSAPRSVQFHHNGYQMFVADTESIYSYTLENGWRLQDVAYNETINFADLNEDLYAFAFIKNKSEADEGSALLLLDGVSETLNKVRFDIPYNFSSARRPTVTSFEVGAFDETPRGILWGPGGRYFFMIGSETNSLFKFDIGSDESYQITNSTHEGTVAIPASVINAVIGIWLKPPPQEITPGIVYHYHYYVTGDDKIAEYTTIDLSTLSGSELNQVVTLNIGNVITVSEDGLWGFVAQGTKIKRINFGSPLDFYNAVETNNEIDISRQADGAVSATISPNGDLLWVCDSNLETGAIFEYQMTAPFDLSTASYTGNRYKYGLIDISNQQPAISPDGRKLWIAGNNHDSIYEFTSPGSIYRKWKRLL